MKAYEVTLQKSITHTLKAKIEVEAETDDQAAEKALHLAGNEAVAWSEPVVGSITLTAPTVSLVDPIVDLDAPRETTRNPR